MAASGRIRRQRPIQFVGSAAVLTHRPIPAKAGISAAAKRRVIVIPVIYNLRLRRIDSCLRRNGTGGDFGFRRKEISAFAGMAVFYIFGYRRIRYCPQRQKAPPFRRKPESPRRRRKILRRRPNYAKESPPRESCIMAARELDANEGRKKYENFGRRQAGD
ncbi:MAG: hypothetical protein ACR2QC_02265 [Gammaproteobacteria bacterium]